jgi:hypothetical protein
MVTRAWISRPRQYGLYEGVEHGYDSYPAHLGRVLHDRVTTCYDKDVTRAWHPLINAHPGGWWKLQQDRMMDSCQCHKDSHRSEPFRPRAAKSLDWYDYAYILDRSGLLIYAASLEHQGKKRAPDALVPWTAVTRELDWDKIQRRSKDASSYIGSPHHRTYRVQA